MNLLNNEFILKIRCILLWKKIIIRMNIEKILIDNKLIYKVLKFFYIVCNNELM